MPKRQNQRENLASFDKAVADLLRGLEEALAATAIEVALELRENLARATPVVTGRAAASWNVSIGSPDLEYKPRGYFNPIGCYNDGNINVDGYVPGARIYVTNAIPYIRRLNDGYSIQNVPGWIDRTLVEMAILGPRRASSVSNFRFAGAYIL